MKNKILIAFILISVFTMLALSSIVLAQPAGKSPPSPPSGPGANGMQPPSPPSPPSGNMTPPSSPTMGSRNGSKPGNDSKPMKERLEELYTSKESYINQKRQCKEEAMKTNAEKGTCWDKLKPVMKGLLLKEIIITRMRLMQLRDKNITFDNIEEINKTLNDAQKVLEDESSSKDLIKSTAKTLEELINTIEDEATKNQPGLLIKQMDNLMIKADQLTAKLEKRLNDLKVSGTDVTSLEEAFTQYKLDLEKAKENIASAKVKYAEAKSSEEIAKVAKEIRTFLNDAKNSLEKAFDQVKKMSPSMDDSGKGGKDGKGNNSNGGDQNGNKDGGDNGSQGETQ